MWGCVGIPWPPDAHVHIGHAHGFGSLADPVSRPHTHPFDVRLRPLSSSSGMEEHGMEVAQVT